MSKLVVCAIAALIGGCTSKTAVTTATPSPSVASSSSVPAGTEPKTTAELKAIAQLHFNSFSYGDFATFWDDFDTAAKAVVSRDEYVRRLESCMKNDPNKNSPFSVLRVAQNADGTWSVAVHYVKYEIKFPARYENGHWRFILSPDAQRAMRMPFDQYLSTQCAKPAR